MVFSGLGIGVVTHFGEERGRRCGGDRVVIFKVVAFRVLTLSKVKRRGGDGWDVHGRRLQPVIRDVTRGVTQGGSWLGLDVESPTGPTRRRHGLYPSPEEE